MLNKSGSFLLMNYPFIDFDFLKRHIMAARIFPHARTSAYAIAKKYRQARPSAFCRVFKVVDDYFVVTDKDDYEYYWALRKIAMRNERKKKNETL